MNKKIEKQNRSETRGKIKNNWSVKEKKEIRKITEERRKKRDEEKSDIGVKWNIKETKIEER